ncbi:MAG: hypothetical protein DMF65_05715 [Acidobacteria bacterium]|nr:MAG: hypothetical protein DMF65_05715 [Acidobacteriota bacterium]
MLRVARDARPAPRKFEALARSTVERPKARVVRARMSIVRARVFVLRCASDFSETRFRCFDLR